MSRSASRGNESAARDTRWERTKANIKTIGGAVLLAIFIRVVLFEAFEIDGPSMMPTLLHGDRVVVAKFLYGLFIPFTNEALFTWGIPRAGDIVIVRSPRDNIDIVKRVIGVPGDRIEVRDDVCCTPHGNRLSCEPAGAANDNELAPCEEPSVWMHDVVYRNGRPLVRRLAHNCRDANGRIDENSLCTEEGIGNHTWFTSRDPFPRREPRPEERVPPGHIYVLGDHRDHSNDSRNPEVGMIPASRVKGRALAIYWSNDDGVRWNRIFDSVR
jgi:signal peptidase I